MSASSVTAIEAVYWYPKLVAPHSVDKPVKSDATIFFIPP